MIEDIIQQYILPITQWLVGLFTTQEWKSLILLLLVTIALTQLVKVGWRLLPIPADRLTYMDSIMYLITCVISFVCAPFIWPPGLSWWIPGIIGGPASAVAFKIGFSILKKCNPDIAASFNADRRRNEASPESKEDDELARRKTDKDQT